jgi:hypothetical protein
MLIFIVVGLSGSFSGLTIGAAEGLYLGMKLPGTRLKLNAMLNAMGKRGAKAGNAIASLGKHIHLVYVSTVGVLTSLFCGEQPCCTAVCRGF